MDEITKSRIAFGKRVREKREEAGLTLDELAKLMGYKHRSSINKLESGENSIPQGKIELLARLLGTTVPYLMGWEVNVSLNKEEYEIIQLYRRADFFDKQTIKQVLSRYKEDTHSAVS